MTSLSLLGNGIKRLGLTLSRRESATQRIPGYLTDPVLTPNIPAWFRCWAARAPAEIIQRNTVQQHVAGEAVSQSMSSPASAGSNLPSLHGTGNGLLTHRHAVVRETSIRRPWPTAPKLMVAMNAVCSSG